MDGKRMLNKALSQALRLEAGKAATRLPARQSVVRARATLGPWLLGIEQQDWVTGMLAAWGHWPS
jgi:hypothetical protein